jgi:oxygen-dependent protoporphyrinogen oxidase
MKVVIGGGLCGLMLGYLLSKQHEVLVLEASERPGGLVQTHFENGYLLERGPHGFQGTPEMLQLLQELGLEPIQAPPMARYIWKEGTLHPITFPQMTLSPGIGGDQTVEEYFRERLGSEMTI